MRCLIVEKRPDGTYQTTAYVNADGSATVEVYKTVGEIALVVPALRRSLTGLSKDSDRLTVFFNADGTVNRCESHVFSINKDDAGEKSSVIEDLEIGSVYNLVNDVRAKNSLPPISKPIDSGSEEPIVNE